MPVDVIWVVVGLGLLIAEIVSTTFYAVFLAGGAFAAALVAYVLPDSSIGLQAVVGVVIAVAGVALVRPVLGRRFQRRVAGAIGPGVHGGFVGQSALALDAIGDALHPGHVRLAGEIWLAITDAPSTIPGDAPVVVRAVRGTTLLVRPAGASPVPSPEG